MRLLFLLGSGISIDAGMPSVCEITRQVLSGEGAFRHTDGLFYIRPDDSSFESGRQHAQRVIDFVGELRDLAESFQRANSPCVRSDYEELGYLASQVADAVGEYENPALLPLLQQLASQHDGNDVIELADRAHEYIRDTTWRMLAKEPGSVEHLAAIVDGCQSLAEIDVFTLNQDRVIERALTTAGISFSDRFGREYGDLRIWNDDFSDANVRLFKLHGSISWWAFTLRGEAWRGPQIACAEAADVYHLHGPDGELLDLPNNDLRPVVLTGTFDKILRYESWIFPDLHARLHAALRSSTRVIVIGYGFRDKAINSRISAWLAREPENRLVVVHPNPPDLCERARGAIRHKWEDWHNRGQLRVVKSKVANATWEHISKELS